MSHKRFRWWWAGVGLGAFLLSVAAPAAPAASIMIDDFGLPNPGDPFFISALNPDSSGRVLIKHSVFEKDEEHLLGAERDVFVEVCGPPMAISAGGIVAFDPDSQLGLLQIATFGEAGTTVTVQYDGPDTLDSVEGGLVNAYGLPELDLTCGGGNDGFLLHFAGTDGVEPDGLDIRVLATSPAPDGIDKRVAVYTGYCPNSYLPYDVFIPFSEFVVAGEAGEDPLSAKEVLSSVDSVTFEFNGHATPNVDFELDYISVVPEPSALMLLGLTAGLLVIMQCRRRKRRIRVLTGR